MDLKDELIADCKIFAIDMATKYYPNIEEYFKLQAAKTTTPFDDYMVGMLLSWGKTKLEELKVGE